MSVRIPTACLALAALLGLLRWGPVASAKPPDLPADPEVRCAPEAPPLAGTTGIPVVAPADVDVRAAAAWCRALRTAQRCLLGGVNPLLALLPDQCLLAEEYEEAAAALLAGQAAGSADEEAEEHYTTMPGGTPVSPPQGLPLQVAPPLEAPKGRFMCPYLREEDARQHRTQACPLATPSDVVGNLHKLEEAQELVERGDYYRDTGHPNSASFYYEKAQRLCPGSRFSQMAGTRLRRLAGQPRMVSATYDVRDLLGDSSADQLIHCITTSIHPQSWGMMGGPGVISHDIGGRMLMVYQTPDVQEQIADFLAARRRQMAESKHATPAEEESSPPATTEPPGDEEQSTAPAEEGVGPLVEACQRALHAGRYAKAEALARRALALNADAVLEHPLVYKEHLLTELGAKVGHPVVMCPGAAAESQDQAPQAAPSAEALQHFQVLYHQGLYTEAQECALQGLALDPQNPALAAAVQIAAVQGRMSAPPASVDGADCWRDLVDLVQSAACAEVQGSPLASRGCCRVPLGCISGELSWDNRGEHGSIMLKLQIFDAPSEGQRHEAKSR